jgi:glycosyltransferase involved in cell wall biosynthesis
VKAAVYDRFWHSMGGGERHAAMIAQLLSTSGVEVDLVGHSDVDRDELAHYLGLDLAKTTMRVLPDRGDDALVRLSEEYDLFVNATHMSRLAPRSRHAAYLCFFPTPFDHDLAAWRKAAIRVIGPHLRRFQSALAMAWGTGWYPPEGGRRRQWGWTNGDGIITLEPGDERVFRFDLGRPGASSPVQLTVADGDERVLASVTVTPSFRVHRLAVPPSDQGRQLHFRSDTFVPGAADTRTLGVAVSRFRLVGSRNGPRQLVAYRFPWLLRKQGDLAFLQAYDAVLANSEYTRGWIRRLWHRDADVLYPPILTDRLHPAPARERTILTVGRFFAPELGHSKRQLEMVQMFGHMVRQGWLDGWTLHVVGGCEDFQRPYLEKVTAAAAGLPVEFSVNAPRAVVERLMSTAAMFWSATGYGEDEQKAPWAHEHFGMTTAEAMAGGCVPVVIDRAGQREIVRDGVDGFRWSTADELAGRTLRVAGDEELRARLAASAVQRAREYSDAAFADRWRDIVDRRGLLDGRDP